MGRKMTCPACKAHLSDVLNAFEEGRPCPNCGLSAEAALEILAVQSRRADEELTAKLETAIKDRDEAQRELRWTKARLECITELVNSPLQEEEESSW